MGGGANGEEGARARKKRAARSAVSFAPLPSVLATTVDVPTEIKGEEIIIWQGERRYRVRIQCSFLVSAVGGTNL